MTCDIREIRRFMDEFCLAGYEASRFCYGCSGEGCAMRSNSPPYYRLDPRVGEMIRDHFRMTSRVYKIKIFRAGSPMPHDHHIYLPLEASFLLHQRLSCEWMRERKLNSLYFKVEIGGAGYCRGMVIRDGVPETAVAGEDIYAEINPPLRAPRKDQLYLTLGDRSEYPGENDGIAFLVP